MHRIRAGLSVPKVARTRIDEYLLTGTHLSDHTSADLALGIGAASRIIGRNLRDLDFYRWGRSRGMRRSSGARNVEYSHRSSLIIFPDLANDSITGGIAGKLIRR